jgi:putative membrane protein
MMNKFVVTAAALLISTYAFAQTAAESAGGKYSDGERSEDGGLRDRDMFEIASSKLAVEKADPATKVFAQQMITDHTKTSTEMKAMVDAVKVKAAIPAGDDILAAEHDRQA